ncbi:MAG: hypothetical protein JRC68_09220 [Deltaproteobacteria bacterium]|nr:hypothetical protein [Deltaproteobacteria bacterium]
MKLFTSIKLFSGPPDTIVVAVGLEPEKTVYRSLKGKVADLHIIGDAKEPRNIMSAIWDAYEVARVI